MTSSIDARVGVAAARVLKVFGIVIGAALLAAPPVLAKAEKPAPAAKAKSHAKAAAKKPSKPAAIEESEAASRVAAWIAGSGDNNSLPYIIIDKDQAAMFLYGADGKPLGSAPVLIGIAKGDEASPGVGKKTLAQLGPAEKTTPAGRFLAKYGKSVAHEKVLWVDYSTSVALHPVVTTNPKERRLARLQSPTSDDNRISFGCINVPTAFYGSKVRPRFVNKGGIVYILPETKPLEEVFPLMRGWAARNPAL
jgi:hypothetical protein